MIVKCRFCGEKTESSNMSFKEYGIKKVVKKYHHEECFAKDEEEKNKTKCFHCKEKDSKSNMVELIEDESLDLKRYFHKDCYNSFLKEKEFKNKELLELDELVKTIKDIFEITIVPKDVFVIINNIRNGESFSGKKKNTTKRYKEGYTYSLINETFKHCRESIIYSLKTKEFNGLMNSFRYAMAIVVDKLSLVEKRIKKSEKRKELEEIKGQVRIKEGKADSFVSNYKKERKTKKSNIFND